MDHNVPTLEATTSDISWCICFNSLVARWYVLAMFAHLLPMYLQCPLQVLYTLCMYPARNRGEISFVLSLAKSALLSMNIAEILTFSVDDQSVSRSPSLQAYAD